MFVAHVLVIGRCLLAAFVEAKSGFTASVGYEVFCVLPPQCQASYFLNVSQLSSRFCYPGLCSVCLWCLIVYTSSLFQRTCNTTALYNLGPGSLLFFVS